ncbi:MAG: pilus assembly protein PilM [Thermoleophilaceae bacterium]|nr:pilus assembly protein PilM [Thermoleophilaceae bacterium]
MAFKLRKNSGTGSVGLDIDGAYMAAVSASGDRIDRAAATDLPRGLMADGEVADGDRLAEALRDFFKREDLPPNVHLGVSNQQIVVRQIELPRIDDRAEREAAVRFQASEAIAMPLDEAVLDHQIAGFERTDGVERMRVVVVAARRTMVSQLTDAVRAAGLRPQGIDLDAFALVRALAHGGEVGEQARVHCHLGGVVNLAVAVGEACVFTRSMSAPWEGGDAGAAATVLADEIGLSIDYYRGQPGALDVGEIVLSGPGAGEAALIAALGERIAIPSRVADPLPGLDSDGLPEADDPYRYTVAAGLALGAAA